MGFAEIITLLFITLKLLGVIAWSWWLVVMPELIALAIYLLIFVVSIFGIAKIWRKF